MDKKIIHEDSKQLKRIEAKPNGNFIVVIHDKETGDRVKKVVASEREAKMFGTEQETTKEKDNKDKKNNPIEKKSWR